MFFEMPRALHSKVRAAGAQYYLMGAAEGDADEMVMGRLVCDWSIGAEGVDAFLNALTA